MEAEERALCAVCAARLGGELQLGAFSLALTVASLFALVLDDTGWAWWVAVLLAGMVERYVALRLRLDADLFRWLAETGAGLPSLDAAFAAAGIRVQPGRSLADRTRGALDWTRRHVVVCVVQVLLAACALVMGG
jgi:hypothetical protein